MMIRHLRCLVVGSTLLSVAAIGQSAPLVYDFDDGTLQGWTQEMSGGFVDRGDAPATNQTQGVFRYDVTPNSELLSNNGVGVFLGANSNPAHSGEFRILPVPFYNRDGDTSTLLLRSPEFILDGSGDLTAQLIGGDEDDPPPATSALLPSSASATGFQGIALRRVSDDAYVLFGGRGSNHSTWATVTLDQATLAPFVSGAKRYTIDLIDNASGGWGWVGLDTVSIPGFVPSATIMIIADGKIQGTREMCPGLLNIPQSLTKRW